MPAYADRTTKPAGNGWVRDEVRQEPMLFSLRADVQRDVLGNLGGRPRSGSGMRDALGSTAWRAGPGSDPEWRIRNSDPVALRLLSCRLQNWTAIRTVFSASIAPRRP